MLTEKDAQQFEDFLRADTLENFLERILKEQEQNNLGEKNEQSN